MRSEKRISWLYAFLILLVAAGVSFIGLQGYWSNRDDGTPPAQQPSLTAGAVTKLVEEVTYSCSHTSHTTKEISQAEAGLGLDALKERYRDWEVSVADGEMHLRRSRDELCPVCRESMYVGVDNNEVVVFYGIPGGKNELKERTGIPAGGLPAEALADLKEGIRVENAEELSQVLEGLMN